LKDGIWCQQLFEISSVFDLLLKY